MVLHFTKLLVLVMCLESTHAVVRFPSLSDRELLSYDECRDYQNCSVLYCVLKLCTVIITLR